MTHKATIVSDMKVTDSGVAAAKVFIDAVLALDGSRIKSNDTPSAVSISFASSAVQLLIAGLLQHDLNAGNSPEVIEGLGAGAAASFYQLSGGPPHLAGQIFTMGYSGGWEAAQDAMRPRGNA